MTAAAAASVCIILLLRDQLQHKVNEFKDAAASL